MKMLLGVYCNTPHTQLFAAHTLREHLHLLAYNLQQPALDATAIILGVSAHEMSKWSDRFLHTSPWNQSAEHIKEGITNVLLAGNKSALLDNAEKWLNASRCSTLSSLFSGHLIHGITNEREADFIRRHGGTIIHVINVEQHRTVAIANHDFAAYCTGKDEPSELSLISIAQTFRARTLEQSTAA